MHFNPYSVPPFITAIIIAWLGIIVYTRNQKSPVNRSFSLMSFSIVVWLVSAGTTFNCNQEKLAELFARITNVGVSFISITMFHFVISFLHIEKLKKFVIFLYGYGVVCSGLILFTNLLVGGTKQYFWGFYSLAGRLHPIFLTIFISQIILCVFLLINCYWGLSENTIKKQQIKYVLIGIFIFDFSSVDFIPNYGISFYPFGYGTTALFVLFFAYSIVKYRLLEVNLLITRTSIFLVYCLLLSFPFVIALSWQKQLMNLLGENWWLAPLISSTVLATVGPSIYLFIQRKAEALLLQEQRRYQAALRRASIGMGRVKDLKRLLKLTVNIVTRTVHLKNAAIYLFHPPSGLYILKALKGREDLRDRKHAFIPLNAPLIGHLQKHREPLVYDEVKQRGQDFQDQTLQEIGKMMEGLDAALLVPSFIEEDLAGLLVLGKKRSGKLYSHDDLVVFSILANQAALAIENAQFYEDMKKTHDQLMKAEKMATIGTMADGLSHQINNRLHAMGFIAGDALDTIKLQPRENLPPEAKKVYEEMETSLGKIQDNVKRGGEIVEGLLKYSRKADEGFAAIELNKLLDASLEMAQFKIKINQIDITRDFNGRLPAVRGNFTQLQEVFFNIIDNSYDAMVQRKEELKEPGYRGKLEIRAQAEGSHLEIFLKDNGMGVREKDFKRLFTPFFTTKLSSKKGTGLGLYVIRKIIEENHGGKVDFVSEYQQGSQTRLVLPIAM
ncbi:MAG: GAF domain-containing protein [Candidatus Omnitrophica bacterium]|nr:GAF domain-containing protein [Candidatus Omnitrophota bacterium]